MARGTSFLELRVMLRSELRRSINPAVGVEDVPELNRLIVRNYEQLWWAHEWPHLLKFFPVIPMQAGQNMYDMPAGLGYERIKDVAAWFNNLPLRIERGITFEDYAISNPALGMRSSPVLKWDVRYGDGNQEAVEVWPVPASSFQYTLQFSGYGAEPRLVNDNDICLLDDNLVVTYAAADAEKDPVEAKKKAAAGQELFARIKSTSANHERECAVGQGVAKRMLSTRAIVVVRG
jgi:hypothetical protein